MGKTKLQIGILYVKKMQRCHCALLTPCVWILFLLLFVAQRRRVGYIATRNARFRARFGTMRGPHVVAGDRSDPSHAVGPQGQRHAFLKQAKPDGSEGRKEESELGPGASPSFFTGSRAQFPRIAELQGRLSASEEPHCEQWRSNRTQSLKHIVLPAWHQRQPAMVKHVKGLDYYWNEYLRKSPCARNPAFLFDFQREPTQSFPERETLESVVRNRLPRVTNSRSVDHTAGVTDKDTMTRRRLITVFHNGAVAWLPFLLNIVIGFGAEYRRDILVVTTSDEFFSKECPKLGLTCWHASPRISEVVSGGGANVGTAVATKMGSPAYNDFIRYPYLCC